MRERCDPDLSGYTTLITGAGSGIGKACAERLASSGAQIVVLDRDERSAKSVAEEVGGTAVIADLSDPSVVDGLGCEADILVNNAGMQHVAPIEQFDPGRFATIQRVMLEAPFRLAKALLPRMYERGWGRIVHISSVHGQRASAYKSAYVAAKHGLEGLSKVIALEAAGTGVTSNTVCPGYVRTALVEDQIADQSRAHGIEPDTVLTDVLLARTPSKRLVEPSEIAETVAYLCGPSTGSLTGSAITVDGGWTAT